jgi:hypothetical protein
VSRDIPILFSGPMVRALLEGRKSQTRRIIKLPTKGQYVRPDMGGWAATTVGGGSSFTIERDGSRKPVPEMVAIWNQTTGTCIAARYQAGGRLWVRETWQTGMGTDGPQITFAATPDYFDIDAWDGADEGAGPSFNYARCPGATWHTNLSDLLDGSEGKWRSPIHMPRWASRLTLAIASVKIERLQAISDADCLAEGVAAFESSGGNRMFGVPEVGCYAHPGLTPRETFWNLWCALHGPSAWAENPFVVAITFRVINANVDAAEAQVAA